MGREGECREKVEDREKLRKRKEEKMVRCWETTGGNSPPLDHPATPLSFAANLSPLYRRSQGESWSLEESFTLGE